MNQAIPLPIYLSQILDTDSYELVDVPTSATFIERIALVAAENRIVTAPSISSLDDSTFIFIPNGVTPPVRWTVQGSCISNSPC